MSTPIELNARRLLCPLPVIRLQQAIATLSAGDTIKIACTDPGVLHDIPAWCRIHGHHLIETAREEYDIILTVVVGDA